MSVERPPPGAAARSGRRLPTWLFVVVPMLLAGGLVAAVSIAVRSGNDETTTPDVSGPAATLPAVTDAARQLLAAVPAESQMADQLGTAYGEVTVGLATIPDEVQFAQRFRRLPDAEAKLLGRTLGAIQAQLTPQSAGGPRGERDRSADILFALSMAQATVQATDPDATARDQALAVLPFSVQDLEGFDSLAATFASGDMAALAPRIDGALSDAGAAELVSSIAYLIGQRIPPGDLVTAFNDAYNAELP